jgi:hypothetical protein
MYDFHATWIVDRYLVGKKEETMKRSVAMFALTLPLCLIGLASSETAYAGEEPESGLKVDVQFARELAERKPVEPGKSFAPGKVYCWNELKGGSGEYTISHVWYRDGKRVWRQPIHARGKKWVTWSFHNVTAGNWKVDVLDSSGNVIGTGELSVK